ncbi:MAG: alanine racemase [Chloroflexi bacterium AL-W]|nr:alanine racemase [Chloroflexi bacterium AL-N1]NOK69215.1 alanine racemase [Chloroflexi bacterium AL-N10]NOK77198.1 alanine racemase [Chloroflexi bacterium AL-N5]NOK83843.1 alanine racemase [Chloroflexi bacterium AL-W]NOK91053.1 alanine racemase [Chloroflexi bacterium AL-N15]
MDELFSVMTTDRLAWVEVDENAIEQNTQLLCQYIGSDVALFGVVKADAYGHGALIATQAMLAGGATGLAVATVGEGRRLREAEINAPILVLEYIPPEQVEEALRYDLTLTISAPETFYAAAYVGRVSGRPVKAHLKIETGMHRVGFLPGEVVAFLDRVQAVDGVIWEGIYTHFATADEPLRPETDQQISQFQAVLETLDTRGWRFPIIHSCNSAGTLCFPPYHYNAVRAGIALYGAAPSDEVSLPSGFRPALSFHARVVRVATVPDGSPISYGGRYITQGTTRIATIAAGYADGVRRSPPWREVLVHGQRAPIVGRICMDYAMVDVTHIPETVAGDVVILLGEQDGATITAEEVGQWLDTSAYEVLTTIAPGEPRIYKLK